MRLRKMTLVAMLVAMGVVLHYVESLIPAFIPGFKLGLANVVSVFALFYLGPLYYPIISLTRVTLIGLMFGFGTNFILALAGAICSSIISVLLYYCSKLSVYGISASGAFFHVVGQVVTYIFIVDTPYMILYLPILSILSIGSGLLLAGLVSMIINVLPSFQKMSLNRRGGRRKITEPKEKED